MSEQVAGIRQNTGRDPAFRPTGKTWFRHTLLLITTLFTATLAGAIFPFGKLPIFPELNSPVAPDSLIVLLYLPQFYGTLIGTALIELATNPETLIYALSFSVSLVFILASHEAGHYIACRI